MAGAQARMHENVPVRFVLTTRQNSPAPTSPIAPITMYAALATRMLTGPRPRVTSCTIRRTAAGSETSASAE